MRIFIPAILFVFIGIFSFTKTTADKIETRFSEAKTMKAVRFTAGSPDNMYVNDGETIPEPGEKEIRIRVIGTAINRADTLQRMGRYNPPPGASDILGLEASGIVDKVGTNCPSSVSVGQRVMTLLAGGGNAEFVVCRVELVMPVPKSLSLIKAAAIPEVWLTAYQLLHFIGKVGPGDVVLIHAGASGVGTAAIQLVKQAGASSVVTAGSQEKIDFAKSLGAMGGVNYKTEKIAERVMEITGGKGVNLILDCVGASMFEDNIKVIGLDGRWVLYGLMGGAQASLDMRQILGKRISLTGTTLRARPIEYKERLVKEFFAHASPLFENGTFLPIIDRILPFSEIGEAHKLIEGNKNKGKIVLEVSKETVLNEKSEL